MTKRLTMLNRLLAKFVDRRRDALNALSACLCATALATSAHAQLIDGYGYAEPGPVGSAVVGPEAPVIQASRGSMPPPAEGTGVYVGPGGATSIANVPSIVQSQAPRSKLVSQPWPQGPFAQLQPQHDAGSIPCPCNPDCDFTYYGSAEALYMRRDYDERFSLSQASLPPFDYEWAGRITIGQVKDCVNGYEFVYAGPLKWDRERLVTGPGTIGSRINSGFIPAVTAPFNNANSHFQTYQARMNNFELNRRWWAWDVFSTLIGVRVVDYREAYGLISNGGVRGIGIYEDFTRNRMVGPQIGGDLMQPFGLRTLVGLKGKAALLANFSRNELFINTAPMSKVDSAVDIAGMFELGSYVKFSITRSIHLTGGYELWYLPGVATVASQDLQNLNINTADKVAADDDLLIHGANFGAQILF